MNLFVSKKIRHATPAFTMIEIAISIGIIAFALVAIIGILPRGLTVQKDNREDTIVSQDANLFIQAIRTGGVITNDPNNPQFGPVPFAPGLNFLTNYVEAISVSNVSGSSEASLYYTNEPGKGDHSLTIGGVILGLLSTPHFAVANVSPNAYYDFGITNYVRAWVRGINGSALEQNGANSAVAFRYIMDVQITPFVSFPYDVNISNSAWSQRILAAQSISRNLYEAQLTFHWPVLSDGKPGPNHQTYRTMIAGHLIKSSIRENNDAPVYFVFQPQTFTNSVTSLQ